MPFIKSIILILLITWFVSFDFAYASEQPDKIITNISSWNHSTKKSFNAISGYKLNKVELYKNNTYPVYYVDVQKLSDRNNWSFDNSFNIATANGWWAFDIKFYNNGRHLFTLIHTTDKRNKTLNIFISENNKTKMLSMRDAIDRIEQTRNTSFKATKTFVSYEDSAIEFYSGFRSPKYFIWLKSQGSDAVGTVGRYLVNSGSGTVIDWDEVYLR